MAQKGLENRDTSFPIIEAPILGAEERLRDPSVDVLMGFIGQEIDVLLGAVPPDAYERKKASKRILSLIAGKVFLMEGDYEEAIRAFTQAHLSGSVQGEFLLGLAMIMSQMYEYFDALDHLLDASTQLSLEDYAELLRKALEIGVDLSRIRPVRIKCKRNDMEEIAMTLEFLNDMDRWDPQRNIGLFKLLKLLQRRSFQ